MTSVRFVLSQLESGLAAYGQLAPQIRHSRTLTRDPKSDMTGQVRSGGFDPQAAVDGVAKADLPGPLMRTKETMPC